MGTYWKIKNTLSNRFKFWRIYTKHFKINKNQFKDNFGNINSFLYIWSNGDVKVGVCEDKFYTKEFRDEIKKNFIIEVI